MSDEPFINQYSNRKRRIVYMNAGKQGNFVDVPAPAPGDAGDVLTVQPDLSLAWNASGGGGGGVTTSQTVTTLSNSDLRSTSRIEVVPAQGANTIIVPTFIQLIYNYAGNNPFTNDPFFQFSYDNPNDGDIEITTAGLTESKSMVRFHTCTSNLLDEVECVNVKLTVNVASALTGNAANDNTVTVFVTYYVTTIPS